MGADVSALSTTGSVVLLGREIPVSPVTQWLDVEPGTRWQTLFNWMQWLSPIAAQDPSRAVGMFVDRASVVPDPMVDVSRSAWMRTGWDEASVTKRLRLGTCLWELTLDPSLVPAIEALANAAMDPSRYYGPPLRAPHNHGLMSNRALWQAGAALQRPEWQVFAVEREATAAARAFDDCGFTFEQSTAYQRVNLSMWGRSSLAGGPPVVPRETLDAGERSLQALARPDGIVEAIGDGLRIRATPSGEPLWCPATGWVAGTVRGSHYTLRGGPRRWAHGHEDHGSVTWFALGVPVLSERGMASKFNIEASAWSHSMAAHSVLESNLAPESGRTYMVKLSDHSYQLTDRPGGSMRRRTVTVMPTFLVVKDVASAPRTDPNADAWQWTQHWQLEPGWTPDGNGAVFTDGKRLVINCVGGTLGFVQVDSYRNDGSVQPAWDAQCRATGSSVKLRTALHIIRP